MVTRLSFDTVGCDSIKITGSYSESNNVLWCAIGYRRSDFKKITWSYLESSDFIEITWFYSESTIDLYIERAEKLPRPTITEDIPEAEWNFFEDSWSRYKRSTGLEGQSVIDQLWACASHSLARSCYQSGAMATTTEKELLEIMKKLSIKSQNNLISVVQFLSMSQDCLRRTCS